MSYGECRIIFGGQWGSEGKGVITSHLAKQYDIHVRVGAPNAGHTFCHKGVKFSMRQIPIGWINKNALLIIGRGAVIDMDVLLYEIKMCEQFDRSIIDRLRIDAGASIIRNEDRENENRLVELISSVGTGSGSVRKNRIDRMFKDYLQFRHVAAAFHLEKMLVTDTSELIDSLQSKGSSILVEGTQGSGLSLLHGDYPHVTSVDTNVVGIMSEVGLSPYQVSGATMVIRSYPIRVGGKSGPLPREISWEELSLRIKRDVKEYSTVSKKLRRIADYDDAVVDRAFRLNKPDNIAFMFADYIDPRIEGSTSVSDLTPAVIMHVNRIEERYNTPIKYLGTGGRYLSVMNM